jgi:hypothetical protein
MEIIEVTQDKKAFIKIKDFNMKKTPAVIPGEIIY